MLTVLVDYDAGNLHSAEKAFQRMARETGAGTVLVSSQPEDVLRADRVVLPGDGAFPACNRQLLEYTGLSEAIDEVVTRRGRPFFGICVGMQMMATRGLEYEVTPGFDWIPGDVVPIETDAGDVPLKVPHMGWNDLVLDPAGKAHPVLAGVSTGDHAYFVHSFHLRVSDIAQRLAHADYGAAVTAIVGRDNLIGTQFHPEKSQRTGLQLIANFLTWTP